MGLLLRASIAVLGRGVYLWLGRHRVPGEARILEIANGGEVVE